VSSSPLSHWLADVSRVGAHNGAHRVALRAGISVAVPLIAVWALGREDWTLYAAFGAFTALYGRGDTTRDRLKMQSSAATVMVSSLVLGVLVARLPNPEWGVVVVACLWTMVVAAISDALRWHPPGPLFAVFALCAVASVPAASTHFADALLVSVTSAAFSLLVGAAGHLLPRRRALAQATPTPAVPARPPARERWMLLARFGVAAGLAGTLSTALGIGHPYWAIVAAIVPVAAATLSHSFARATHRIGGTVLGLGVAWLILTFEPVGLTAILIVVALQICAELLVGRNYGLALVFVTPLALVMIALAHPTDTTALIRDRAIETALGTVVALAVVVALWGIRRLAAPTPPNEAHA
jgi:hypothetical protein